MRGCLLLVVGIIIGAVLVLYLWRPSSSPVPGSVVVPQRADIHVVLADSYLSRLINARLASRGLSALHVVRVSSDPPSTLVAHANASLGPFSVPVDVEAIPTAQNGSVHIRIASSHVGPVSVPHAFSGIVESSINDALRSQINRSLTVVSTSVRPQGLDVYANYG